MAGRSTAAAPSANGPIFFTRKALTFLRALKRNNDGEWFRAHRADYVTHIQEPLHRLLETLNEDLHDVAPELACTARESTFRMYRDTRFSEDKTPLKTHAAAVFPTRGLPRHEGAGLYFEVAPKWVWIGGGMYAPPPPELVRVREHIATTWPRVKRIATSKAFIKEVAQLEGERLTRVPRGFAANHPAADYLKHRQFIAGRELPADIAADDAFYPTLITTFKAILPLVRFLNEPLTARADGHTR